MTGVKMINFVFKTRNCALKTVNSAAFVQQLWPLLVPYLAKNGGPIVMLQLENENGRAFIHHLALHSTCLQHQFASFEHSYYIIITFAGADPTDPYVQYVATLARSLNSVSKSDEFCIKNEELCIKNEEFCVKNDEICSPFPSSGVRAGKRRSCRSTPRS